MSATACITLKRGDNDKKVMDVATGTGPIYASLRCIEKIIRHPFALEEYSLNAVTEHKDALGEALVKISDQRGVFRGRGVSTDVIEASIVACINAVNKMLDESSTSIAGGVAAQVMSFENDLLLGHTDKEIN